MHFLFMLIVFGCAAYSVAVSKGKNPYVWFAVGLVIGPFAVLILAFYPAKEDVKKIDKSAPDSATVTEIK